MSIEVMTQVWKHADASGGELLVLLALADYSNEDRGCAWPSVRTLAKKSRLGIRQTQYAIRNLEAKGLIRIEAGAGPRGVNLYTVYPEGGALECRGAETAGCTQVQGRGAPHCIQTVIEPLVPTSTKFQKPSLDQVREYGTKELEPPLPPDECDKFWNYYESNGWKVGRNPMKNWKAAMVNWRKGYQAWGSPTTRHRSVLEIQRIIDAKRTVMLDLRAKHCHESPTGDQWENNESRNTFIRLKKEVRELTNQLATMQ